MPMCCFLCFFCLLLLLQSNVEGFLGLFSPDFPYRINIHQSARRCFTFVSCQRQQRLRDSGMAGTNIAWQPCVRVCQPVCVRRTWRLKFQLSLFAALWISHWDVQMWHCGHLFHLKPCEMYCILWPQCEAVLINEKAKPGRQLLNWIVVIAYPITTSSRYLCLSGKRVYVRQFKTKTTFTEYLHDCKLDINIYI